MPSASVVQYIMSNVGYWKQPITIQFSALVDSECRLPPPPAHQCTCTPRWQPCYQVTHLQHTGHLPLLCVLKEMQIVYLKLMKCCISIQFSSVQFSCLVVSDSLWPHESQYTRPPCPSPTPGVHSHSRPLSRWCHPAISSSVIPFSSCPQPLPASESKYWSFSFSIIPSNEHPGLISFRMNW